MPPYFAAQKGKPKLWKEGRLGQENLETKAFSEFCSQAKFEGRLTASSKSRAP